MKEKFWEELLEIFTSNENLQNEHQDLYKNISLIVDVSRKHNEIEELNKVLTELNK